MLATRARYVGFADAIYLRHDMLHTICSRFARTCFAASRHCTSAQRTYRIAFTRYIVFIYRIAQQYIVRPAGRSSFNLTIFRKPNDKIRALCRARGGEGAKTSAKAEVLLLPNSLRGAVCLKRKGVSTSAEVDLRNFLRKVP